MLLRGLAQLRARRHGTVRPLESGPESRCWQLGHPVGQAGPGWTKNHRKRTAHWQLLIYVKSPLGMPSLSLPLS